MARQFGLFGQEHSCEGPAAQLVTKAETEKLIAHGRQSQHSPAAGTVASQRLQDGMLAEQVVDGVGRFARAWPLVRHAGRFVRQPALAELVEHLARQG